MTPVPRRWYLYAVAGADDITGVDLPSGIDGAPVQAMQAAGLAAIAGGVDPSLFEAAQAKPDLDEHAWLAGALRAHDRVARRMFAQIPVVPWRFGALVARREGVRELVMAERERLCAALEVARDMAEWRVTLIPSHPSEVDTQHEQWLKLAGQVRAVLSVYAVETDGRLPTASDVYLVRRRDENAFRAAASALAGLLSGTEIRVEISGPAPPCHV